MADHTSHTFGSVLFLFCIALLFVKFFLLPTLLFFFLSHFSWYARMPRVPIKFTGNGSVRRQRTFVRAAAASRSRMMAARRFAPEVVSVTPERKYFDTTLANTAIPASADWTATEFDPVLPANTFNLCSPGPGTAINQRVGRKILVHAVKIRGVLNFTILTAQTAVPASPTIRLVVFQDKQTNGVQAQGEQIMAAPGTAAAQNAISSYQNLANFGRFRVLVDKVYQFKDGVSVNNASATTVSADYGSIPFKFNVKFQKPVVVHFNATGTALVADIVDNSFHIIANADITGSAISYEARAVYTDA